MKTVHDAENAKDDPGIVRVVVSEVLAGTD